MEDENEITFKIRGAIFEVYNTFGPGLFESVYVKCLVKELKDLGLQTKTEVPVNVNYKGEEIDCSFRLDILVEDLVIIEVKAIENLAPVHHKQLLTYLKITKKKLGLLVNFNVDNMRDGIIRKINSSYLKRN